MLRYRVEGMDCPSCASKIETALGRLPGVDEVKVTYSTEILALQHDPARTSTTEIESTVTALGFETRSPAQGGARHAGHDHEHEHDHDHAHDHGDRDHGYDHGHDHGHDDAGSRDTPLWKTAKARLVGFLGALIVAAFVVSHAAPGLERWAYTAAVLVGVVPFARRAWTLARLGSPFSIETLMVIAALGALAIGATDEAAIVIFLFAIGELLESVAADRARSGIRSLVALIPRTALVEDGESTREVEASALAIDQVMVVRPGDRIAADGRIVSGETTIDESPVTGESAPVLRTAGDEVYAGTINLSGALRVAVTREAADNTVARIVRLVEEAQEAKSPTARFIDRFARWYTPGAMAAAALTILVPTLAFGGDWYTWIYRGLSLLLIACPCALVLSTPAAIAAGLAAGARHGLLVKGGAALEAIGRVTTVAFDKTGTLTEGKPHVTDVIALGGSVEETLRLAAAVEAASSHPIGAAILTEAGRRALAVPGVVNASAIGGKAVTGEVDGLPVTVGSPRYAAEQGVLDDKARRAVESLEEAGKTTVLVILGSKVMGAIALRDEPRPDAREAVAGLKALGIRAVMLTGDNRRTGQAIGESLGLEVKAELLPQGKLDEIEALKRSGPVAMVGDGINDAPALAAASVGVAMGGGTDVALETADAALVKSRVGGIAELVRLSRATLGNIHQNIGVAVSLKAIFLVTTLLGVTTMWMAIMADTGATVLVTMNALRLLRFRP
jgi:Cd2+/Zn2+-exporting ATPase